MQGRLCHRQFAAQEVGFVQLLSIYGLLWLWGGVLGGAGWPVALLVVLRVSCRRSVLGGGPWRTSPRARDGRSTDM